MNAQAWFFAGFLAGSLLTYFAIRDRFKGWWD